MDLRQTLIRSVAEEGEGLRAVRYDPDARDFEAFSFRDRTRLLDPLSSTSLDDALAEVTGRWSWDRGDRLAVREIGDGRDLLHIYVVRKKSQGSPVWGRNSVYMEHRRWLDHVGTVDLQVLAGLPVGLVGSEIDLHERRQRQRPAGARHQSSREREAGNRLPGSR